MVPAAAPGLTGGTAVLLRGILEFQRTLSFLDYHWWGGGHVGDLVSAEDMFVTIVLGL